MVIRYLLPEGSGPGATDVIGECVEFSDVAVIRREDGELVRVAVDDIVTGKPVPPRASVRQRVSARDAEDHTLRLFPGVEQQPLGDWVLRFEPAPVGRLRKRANSCLAMGEPDRPLPQALEAITDFYRSRDRDVLAQVELDSPTDATLSASGWEHVPGGDAHFLLTSLSHALRGRAPAVEGLPEPTITEDGERCLVQIPGIAVGEATFERDWLGIHGLEVAPGHRRRGIATAVLRELLEWGAELGGSTVWLHVETGNGAAMALYTRLGFRVHHTNRYLRRPAG